MDMLDSYCAGELVEKIIPFFERSRDYYTDVYQSEREYEQPDDSCELLVYIKDGMFKEHSDTPVGLKFATTLIVIPTDFSGGDLILKTTPDKVHDPDGVLIKEGNKIMLSSDAIKVPVLISFQKEIPHEVTKVTKGYRLCFKMSQTLLPIASFFANEKIETGKFWSQNLPKRDI
jgi:hypothetical protein